MIDVPCRVTLDTNKYYDEIIDEDEIGLNLDTDFEETLEERVYEE